MYDLKNNRQLCWDFDGYTRSKDYKYGKTLITLYRKDLSGGAFP